jgi:hypothetical protein
MDDQQGRRLNEAAEKFADAIKDSYQALADRPGRTVAGGGEAGEANAVAFGVRVGCCRLAGLSSQPDTCPRNTNASLLKPIRPHYRAPAVSEVLGDMPVGARVGLL